MNFLANSLKNKITIKISTRNIIWFLMLFVAHTHTKNITANRTGVLIVILFERETCKHMKHTSGGHSSLVFLRTSSFVFYFSMIFHCCCCCCFISSACLNTLRDKDRKNEKISCKHLSVCLAVDFKKQNK